MDKGRVRLNGEGSRSKDIEGIMGQEGILHDKAAAGMGLFRLRRDGLEQGGFVRGWVATRRGGACRVTGNETRRSQIGRWWREREGVRHARCLLVLGAMEWNWSEWGGMGTE